MKLISEMGEPWKGQDAYIVAAGASAGLIDPSFFDDKHTIGINEVYTRFPGLDIYIRKEDDPNADAVANIRKLGGVVVVSEYVAGYMGRDRRRNKDGDYYFKHSGNELTSFDWFLATQPDYLIVSWSTITSGMHLAQRLGARNIILVGHDCCLLDGQATFKDYPKPIMAMDNYKRWLSQIQEQTIQVRSFLKRMYGVQVYSLNPFVSIDLEGHQVTHE